jgi:hypothetical protein
MNANKSSRVANQAMPPPPERLLNEHIPHAALGGDQPTESSQRDCTSSLRIFAIWKSVVEPMKTSLSNKYDYITLKWYIFNGF